jgi:hypothetical protein
MFSQRIRLSGSVIGRLSGEGSAATISTSLAPASAMSPGFIAPPGPRRRVSANIVRRRAT